MVALVGGAPVLRFHVTCTRAFEATLAKQQQQRSQLLLRRRKRQPRPIKITILIMIVIRITITMTPVFCLYIDDNHDHVFVGKPTMLLKSTAPAKEDKQPKFKKTQRKVIDDSTEVLGPNAPVSGTPVSTGTVEGTPVAASGPPPSANTGGQGDRGDTANFGAVRNATTMLGEQKHKIFKAHVRTTKTKSLDLQLLKRMNIAVCIRFIPGNCFRGLAYA
ncbi:hypothetical protein Dda_7013 [Drechslerella dactyloides]|uniref:Uncharacterized protein n=1 Tax=Drechslerella dactyloides TaxID=74499 RepID=A0AAD6NIQ2_DREDA|nr:hypothetical protein Dda_7013 [Drechslerella dactyloides]